MGFLMEATTIFFILYMGHDIIYATKKTIIQILETCTIIYCDFMHATQQICFVLPSRVTRNLIFFLFLYGNLEIKKNHAKLIRALCLDLTLYIKSMRAHLF